ncbi:glutamate N-acetyltransferase [Bryocella elongata]|uniref:Arginine biosynthesis bifunctional protein ArgJ n=1 Tax=Bryocella elongata TaxID=863522 RepID=A0A1H5Z731_9BACT|nr:bifunctional glutamate N-acetyltransferase/amino-acid acetyltransferase ArgJ [Bryocella elongata]SEG32349.1 glutamate N-acetyltransferase [Bryocella elongata]
MTRNGSSASLPLGFRWGATTAGIKASGKPDVAIAVADQPAIAAAMFTSNQFVAAPILIGQRHLKATEHKMRAVLVNAGNANCATGDPGLEHCRQSCAAMGDAIGCVFDEVFPSSTGIIGVPLPIEKLVAGIPKAVAALGNTPDHADAFAHAIMTTDTKPKVASESFEIDIAGEVKRVSLWGCCKGAGMIGPKLANAAPHATMLVYLFTDIAASASQLKEILHDSVEKSFNAISVDGDMSTNDTVLLLASGASGVALDANITNEFDAALQRVCDSLAYQVVDDGEGVTHVVTLQLTGAASDEAAATMAKSIANSPLVKTAWSSGDPNWGRLLAAAGKAGVPFDPATVTIAIGGLEVFANGVRSAAWDETATHERMSQRHYTIAINFGMGSGTCKFVTCDLTHEYVSINADYST